MVLTDSKEDIGSAWKAWIGKHEDGWEVAELNERPMIRLNGSPLMSLLATAEPGSNDLRLKVQSLELIFELVEKDSKRVLNVLTLSEGA